MRYTRNLFYVIILTAISFVYIYFNYFKSGNQRFDRNVHDNLSQNARRNIQQEPLMLLISLDGFRWDYFHRYKNLANFDYLRQIGSHADYIETTDPTLTYPSRLDFQINVAIKNLIL